jgi:undecaprenyl-diphosphatase
MTILPLAPWVRRARLEILPLGVLGLLGFLATAFLEVADDVGEGETHSFDRTILYALRSPGGPGQPLGPRWLDIAAADLTALGSVTNLTIVVLFVCSLFLSIGRWRAALLMVLASSGGLVLSQGLKSLYERERPPLELHAVEVINASFPSGHAMMSAAIYLSLGALVARLVRQRRIKVLAVGGALILAVLIGLSRVYLGVHWPTDVLAGWCLGCAWAAAVWLAAYVAERRWPELHEEGETELNGTGTPEE